MEMELIVSGYSHEGFNSRCTQFLQKCQNKRETAMVVHTGKNAPPPLFIMAIPEDWSN
jgi:hypothetical protein